MLDAKKEVIVEGNLKDLKCELCEAIIDSIDKVIGTNATKQEVNETVYGVCGQLPGSLQALVSMKSTLTISVSLYFSHLCVLL